ncbi:MAG: murein biosynthesis integral membrane protein MurJ [Planctomycetota bacterium]
MKRLTGAARRVSLATLVSRVLGLFRDALRAALVGAGALSDALEVAFKVPNLLRDLFAEGAFNGAFVPTLSQTQKDEGEEAAFDLVNRALSTLLIYAGGAVVLLVVFAPQLIGWITDPSFSGDPEKFETAVFYARLLAPFLLFITLAVVLMGALNVRGRFFLPALSPASQNLLLVGGGSFLLMLGVTGESAAFPWALLLLTGGALQFLLQVPAMRREGWRPRFCPDPKFRDPALRQIVLRMAPVVLGLAATHLCILINLRLASQYVGGVSFLYYGFRLVHLPVGLVGVAVGTAALAEAARQAAAGDREAVARTMGDGLRLCLAFAIPAAVGLMVLGGPIAHLLFGYGATEAAEANAIGQAITLYALAVVPYCAVKVLVPVYYAVGKMRVPLLASVFAVAANLAVAIPLARNPDFQWRALAIAVGAGQAVNLLILMVAGRRHFLAGRPGFLAAVVKMAAAACACGGATWAVSLLLPGGEGFLARAAAVFGPTVAGVAAYFAVGRLLGSQEILAVVRLDRSGNAS